MKGFTTFRGFFGALFGIFLFTWMALVVYPWLELGHLSPIIDDDNVTITPWDSPGAAHAGERVYAANGCVYCHTQQVRDGASGEDMTRGWGTAFSAEDPKDTKKDVTRRSYPRDYIWQGQTFLGSSREGADLSNVAYRFRDAAGLYSYLYDPYVLNPHSAMPAYRFLFVTKKISGQPSEDALVLPKDAAAPDGYEIVPTAQARSLVAYLLSLNKGYHLKADEAGLRYEPPAPTKS
jgi:cytochrome c oxidase cbb3-type subunit 2